jgi:hypothetical protein
VPLCGVVVLLSAAAVNVSRKYLDLRGRKWREAGEDYIMRNFLTCTCHQILLG